MERTTTTRIYEDDLRKIHARQAKKRMDQDILVSNADIIHDLIEYVEYAESMVGERD